MITVHIVDDHNMLIEALQSAIDNSGFAKITGVSNTLAECRKMLTFNSPDVLILDLSLPDGKGADFCKEMRRKYPDVKILVVTFHDEYSIIKNLMSSGASAYILKCDFTQEVLNAIEAVCNGEIYLSEKIEKILKKRNEQPIVLTPREQDIAKLIIEGLNTREIADKLGLRYDTVKTNRKKLNFKIGARNAAELVKIVIEKKLI